MANGLPFHFLLFKRNIQNRTGLKGPPFNFFETVWFFSNILSPKGPTVDLFEVPPRIIRSEALYPNFWRYIRTEERKFQNLNHEVKDEKRSTFVFSGETMIMDQTISP